MCRRTKMGNTILITWFIILCSVWVSPAFASTAKIYKTVHADGSITYSDQASSNAVEVQLDVNSMTIQSRVSSTPPLPQNRVKPKPRHVVSILSPAPDATIRNNAGNINIAASLEPKLAGLFELSINGQTYESMTGVFTLTQMDRGSYQYSVSFIDNSGKLIASSDVLTLHLHKASALIN